MNKTLITAVCIIVSAVFGFLVAWPKYQILRVGQTNVEVKGAELADKKLYFQNLAATDEKLQEYSSELSIIDKAIPKETLDPFIFYLFQNEVSQGRMALMNLGAISSAPSTEHVGLTEHTLTLSVSGPYEDFKNFLTSLEKSARIIGINQISFSSPEDPDSPFDVSLSANFYSY